MYVTINVMIAMIRVRIKVITNVMATAAPVDNESSWNTWLLQQYEWFAIIATLPKVWEY